MFENLKSFLGENLTGYSSILKQDMKLKDGTVFPAGTRVVCEFPHDKDSYFHAIIDGREIKIPYKSASKYLNKFKAPPTDKALEKMVMDGIATTPLGARTEPDGHGPNGEPSWLLVLGFI